MANSSAHRLPDHHRSNHHRLSHLHAAHGLGSAASLPAQVGGSSSVIGGGSVVDGLGGGQVSGQVVVSSGGGSGGGHNNANKAHHHYKGHQRRQSVARLLPDISKLRLLSWLVEASSELINCDIAIMDGVYAKLNRSRESLLFWDSNNSSQQATVQSPTRNSNNIIGSSSRPAPPPPPSVQPVANRILISQQQQQRKLSHQQLLSRKQQRIASRNHHSLPITNYDASSLAAVSLSPSLPQPRSSVVSSSSSGGGRKMTSDTESLLSSFRVPGFKQPLAEAGSGLTLDSSDKQPMGLGSSSSGGNSDAQQHQKSVDLSYDDSCDSNQSDDNDNDEDDDDDNISAASSSSGIHGGETSLSSTGSTSSSAASTASNGDVAAATSGRPSSIASGLPEINSGGGGGQLVSSAELLSEKIRRTVMKHNYLQGLLVNIIRQHDRLRDQRRRQMSLDQSSVMSATRQQQQRIDLVDIADSIDDGCFCSCHSTRQEMMSSLPASCNLALGSDGGGQKSSTLPTAVGTNSNQQAIPPSPSTRKLRRLKKVSGAGNNTKLSDRQNMINLLADKLCENCFETHCWLHGCSPELAPLRQHNLQDSSVSNNILSSNHNNGQDLNATIAKRNATFIKLVQQEVRSTISKSIELIDLIRKEIKLPESIKQKQLMRCFSTSIQLLTSVGNYVVPAQDISSFIPDCLGQQETTTLYSLPSSDFDHLLFYPPSSCSSNNNNNSHHHLGQQPMSRNYHLAQAPEIPIRRRPSGRKSLVGAGHSSATLATSQRMKDTLVGAKSSSTIANHANTSSGSRVQQDSSSGASSNNSSASSSIARGAVQQSSLTRAQTSSAILDTNKTTTTTTTSHHGLSFEAIANLSRQQTDDDILYQTRPKFWQSSKFNFIKKLLHVKQQRLLRQQSKDRRIYNNKVQNKFRLVMMDLTHFNKSQQLLTTENGVNSLLTSMRNVLEFGLYLTLKLY